MMNLTNSLKDRHTVPVYFEKVYRKQFVHALTHLTDGVAHSLDEPQEKENSQQPPIRDFARDAHTWTLMTKPGGGHESCARAAAPRGDHLSHADVGRERGQIVVDLLHTCHVHYISED